MIDGQNFCNQPVGNYLITFDNIQKIATGQEENYTTGNCQTIIILKTMIR